MAPPGAIPIVICGHQYTHSIYTIMTQVVLVLRVGILILSKPFRYFIRRVSRA